MTFKKKRGRTGLKETFSRSVSFELIKSEYQTIFITLFTVHYNV